MSAIAAFRAQHGVAPGAYIYVADAALGTEANLAALGDTRFITRLPATYNECGRIIAEAVAHNTGEECGVIAATPPPRPRPVARYKAYDGEVTLYGTSYRAVVSHTSAQDQRRQQRLARESQASYSTLQTATRLTFRTLLRTAEAIFAEPLAERSGSEIQPMSCAITHCCYTAFVLITTSCEL